MSSGGGSGSDGGKDMQVSGAEAAHSIEPGISTHADTQVQQGSFSPGTGGEGQADYSSMDQEEQAVADTQLGPDTSMVGKSAPTYSDSEIEKGYTDEGVKLDQVGAGQYMTKAEQYSTGLIEKDPLTGEDQQGRYRVNENTGQLERTDLSFADHWKNAPGALKASPTLRLLYAGGKNIGEWMSAKGFEGYSEAGKRPNDFLGNISGSGEGTSRGGAGDYTGGAGEGQDQQRAIMNALAPEAPYIVSGTTQPSNSPAANWYANLGQTNTNPGTFNLATEYAAAKSKVAKTLGTSSAVGQLAVNQSSFFNWLKDNSLDKGIL